MQARKLGCIAAVAALTALTGCSAAQPAEGTVVFGSTGGTFQEASEIAWMQPFTESTGIPVVQDSPADMAKALEMVKSGSVTWDAFLSLLVADAYDNDSFEEIDCEIVDCAQFDGGAFKMRPQAAPFFVFSYVALYNTDTFPEGSEPSGIADFFNTEEFPGKRLMPKVTGGWQGFLEAALIADGVPREELYPLDVERALGVFDRIRDDIDVMADDGECVTEVASGETAFGACYNGRAEIGKRDGLPIDIAWGQQIQFADYLFIPKGAKNVEGAQKLIAFLTDKENNGAIVDEIAYAPANPLAVVPDDAEWANAVPTAHVLEGDLAPIYPDEEWWMENKAAVVERLSEWLQS